MLDEPTSMLDASGRREVLDRVRTFRGEKTILHVTHHLDEISDADRLLVLNGGNLVADGDPGALLSDTGFMQQNRLVLPPGLRLAADLGLVGCRTPEDLAEAIAERSGVNAR